MHRPFIQRLPRRKRKRKKHRLCCRQPLHSCSRIQPSSNASTWAQRPLTPPHPLLSCFLSLLRLFAILAQCPLHILSVGHAESMCTARTEQLSSRAGVICLACQIVHGHSSTHPIWNHSYLGSLGIKYIRADKRSPPSFCFHLLICTLILLCFRLVPASPFAFHLNSHIPLGRSLPLAIDLEVHTLIRPVPAFSFLLSLRASTNLC
jgi:hypothetical protein